MAGTGEIESTKKVDVEMPYEGASRFRAVLDAGVSDMSSTRLAIKPKANFIACDKHSYKTTDRISNCSAPWPSQGLR